MKFDEQLLKYHFNLKPRIGLPEGISWLLPYGEAETRSCMTAFYHQYYHDTLPRTFILGINPGRHGGGLTGVPFTDPVMLERLGIKNNFPKKHELSSVFIYDMIAHCGGPVTFFHQFYITSLNPLGLLKGNVNYNYYDDPALARKLEPIMVENIEIQIAFGARREEVFCLGRGKNFDYLKKLNDRHAWWERVTPLPHPRWIMQYRLKQKADFIKEYQKALLTF